MKPLRILIADDHEVVRKGVRALLETRSDWEVCGEATTGREAVEASAMLDPQVIVMDLSMPELDGFDAMREIRRAGSTAEFLVFTVHESGQIATRALAAGARGLVFKADAALELVAAVDALSHHTPFMSRRATEAIVTSYSPGSSTESSRDSLTSREEQVLKALARGKASKEIATQLEISIKTVDAHRANLMRKLRLRSLSELIHYAIRNRIIDI